MMPILLNFQHLNTRDVRAVVRNAEHYAANPASPFHGAATVLLPALRDLLEDRERRERSSRN